MAAYMYPIIIKREPQKIRYNKDVVLDSDILTLEILRQYVSEDEKFSIETDDWLRVKISITGERMETKDEYTIRVNREESYMNEYNKRHNIK